jgi:hypothetical protein
LSIGNCIPQEEVRLRDNLGRGGKGGGGTQPVPDVFPRKEPEEMLLPPFSALMRENWESMLPT